MALMKTFTDNFDDNSINTSLWDEFEAGSATITEQNGRLEVAFPGASTSSTDGDVTSDNTYDFRESFAQIKIIEMPSALTAANGEFAVILDADNYFNWKYEQGILYAQREVATNLLNVTSFEFDLEEHAYLRIRESGNVVYWETSPDGITWTSQGSYIHVLDLSAMSIFIGGYCYQNETNPGYFIVDDFNVTATQGFANTISDNFNNPDLDTDLWEATAPYELLNDVLALSSTASATTYGMLETIERYSLIGNSVTTRLLHAGNQTLASFQAIPIAVYRDASNTLNYFVGGGLVTAQKQVAGVFTTVGSTIAYNKDVHKYFRIREQGGTVYFDYSTDGINWTNQSSVASPFGMSNVKFRIMAGTYSSETVASTALFDDFNVPPIIDSIKKEYRYEMYRDGRFLGVLQKVTSPFTYSLDINSAFAQLTVECPINPYTADQRVEELLDESGNVLLDEQNNTLYEERRPDVIGDDNENALIRYNNDIKVYEISKYHPNGVLVFDGYIETYRANYSKNNVIADCLSNGADMVDYIINTGGFDSEISQPTSGWQETISGGDGELTFVLAQSFTPATTFDLGKISVKMSWEPSAGITNHGLTLGLYLGAPTGGFSLSTPALATVEVDDIDEVEHWLDFVLSEAVTVQSGQVYHFAMWTTNYESEEDTEYSPGSVTPTSYAGGATYYSVAGAAWDPADPWELAFEIFSTDNATQSEFTLEDPSTMLELALDNYNGQGGAVTYDSDSIDDTGESISYTFKMATMLDFIRKCLELAPADWWWSVDPGSGLVSFKAKSETPDHIFVLGKHLDEFEFVSTGKNIRNVAYFNGGDVLGDGVNLFAYYINQDSIDATGRRRLATFTDNRVIIQATADAMVANLFDEQASGEYQSPISILDKDYDISTIHPGETCVVLGHGNFIDNIVFQIARVQRYPDRVELVIGKLPTRQTSIISRAINDINDLQTIDNPNIPS